MLTLTKRKFATAAGTKDWAYQITGTCKWTGKFIRKGTRTRDLKVAEHKLHELEEELREKAKNGDRIDHNFAAAVAEYLAKHGEERYLDKLFDHFAKWPLKTIKDTDLSAFCAAHYPGAKASTLVRQVYGPMQWVWNAAVRAELCDPKEFAKPEIKREPVKYARSDDWLMAVLKACTNLNQRCALAFMSFSGARAHEVVLIRVMDYSYDQAVVVVRTKGGKERQIPLSPAINAALSQLVAPDRDRSEPLFGYASRYSLNRILRRACKRAGVEHLSPHRAGRHSFAARLLRDGASLKELQEAGGWDDIGVVAKHYSHLERSAVDARIRNVATTIRMENITLGDTLDNSNVTPLRIATDKQ